jgi:hypothetical protein
MAAFDFGATPPRPTLRSVSFEFSREGMGLISAGFQLAFPGSAQILPAGIQTSGVTVTFGRTPETTTVATYSCSVTQTDLPGTFVLSGRRQQGQPLRLSGTQPAAFDFAALLRSNGFEYPGEAFVPARLDVAELGFAIEDGTRTITGIGNAPWPVTFGLGAAKLQFAVENFTVEIRQGGASDA